MSKIEKYDIIVIGGGPSGSNAGIIAARSGLNVLVVEKHSFMGGSLTAMGVGPMMSFHNPAGEQVIMGLAEEIIQRLKKIGASPGHVPDSVTYCSTVTPFDSESLKIELETMLLEAGGKILYHTHFAGAKVDLDGNIESVQLCNKAGLKTYEAKIFIDATGDGDLSAALGAPFEKGRSKDKAMQPMTMNLKIANVNMKAVRQDVIDNPENFEFDQGLKEGLKRLRLTSQVSLKAYINTWKEAKNRGELDVPREYVLFFETATPGVVIVNTSRIQGLDGTDPYDLSKAEVIGRQQNLQIFKFLKKYCKGFENAIPMDGASQVGVRETRRILGLYSLTAEDILTQKNFEEPISLGGYPIDIHSPDKEETKTNHLKPNIKYQIPMKCLLLNTPNNLVLAGRCISATHEALAAFRVSPIAMAIGQAAGTIAIEAVKSSIPANKVQYKNVRRRLLKANAKLPS